MVANTRIVPRSGKSSPPDQLKLCANIRERLDRVLLLQRYSGFGRVAVVIEFEWSEISRLEMLLAR